VYTEQYQEKGLVDHTVIGNGARWFDIEIIHDLVMTRSSVLQRRLLCVEISGTCWVQLKLSRMSLSRVRVVSFVKYLCYFLFTHNR